MAEKENREYKNSVFVDLFFEDESAEENDISLYNALHDEPLPPCTKIQKIRVDKVLYMNFKNDISFGIGGKVLVFGEHQTTVNKNMPLRSLMYIGRIYEKLVPVRDRYRRTIVPLPRPEFFTFYNGPTPWVKETVLKLSDAYETPGETSMLDLAVKVININPGEHHEVLEKCPVLKEYGEFVDTIRKYQEADDPDAYKHAVEECIQKGILADYLAKKGSEVVNMLIAEYDYDLDIEVQREEAFNEGRAEGEAFGRAEGEALGRIKGEALTLINIARKKAAKGVPAEDCADFLEADVSSIQQIYQVLTEHPDWDAEKIYNEFTKSVQHS